MTGACTSDWGCSIQYVYVCVCVCVCVCVRMLAYIYPCMSLLSIPVILGHRIIAVNSQSNLNYPKPIVLQMINTENETWIVTCPMSWNASKTKSGLEQKSPDSQFYTFPSPSYLSLCWYDWDTPPRSHHSQILLFLYKIHPFVFFLNSDFCLLSWKQCLEIPVPHQQGLSEAWILACIKLKKPLLLWRQIPD